MISYAEQVALTHMEGKLSPQLLTALREHFTQEQILELGTVMAVIAGMAKLSFVLDVVDREDYCPFAADPVSAVV